MLIWRAKELLEGTSELLRAEIELATRRAQSVLVSSILLASCIAIGAIGVGVMLAGAAITLAGEVGWTLSLVIIGGSMLGASLIVWLAVLLRAHSARQAQHEPDSATQTQEDMSPMEQVEDAKERMRNAATPGDDRPQEPQSPRDFESLATSAVEFAAKNPAVVGSAAFLALSLIGPGRALRLVSRGVAAAGLAASLFDKVRDHPDPPKPAEPTARADEHPLRRQRQSATNGRVAAPTRV